MRWVVELAVAASLLFLVFSFYSYTTPHMLTAQAGERGRFAELAEFAVRLASNPDFLFRLQEDWDAAVELARREAAAVDALANVTVAPGFCTQSNAPLFVIALASVLPNGTAVCIYIWR